MKSKKKLTVAGLHLWAVELNDHEKYALLITTRQESLEAARLKAERFLSRNRDRYPESKISGIKDEGVIDA